MRIRKTQISKLDPTRLMIQRRTGNGEYENVGILPNIIDVKLARLQYGQLLKDIEARHNGTRSAREHIATELVEAIPDIQLAGWFKYVYDRSQINHEVLK